jgi:hypothetical protein
MMFHDDISSISPGILKMKFIFSGGRPAAPWNTIAGIESKDSS